MVANFFILHCNKFSWGLDAVLTGAPTAAESIKLGSHSLESLLLPWSFNIASHSHIKQKNSLFNKRKYAFSHFSWNTRLFQYVFHLSIFDRVQQNIFFSTRMRKRESETHVWWKTATDNPPHSKGNNCTLWDLD